MKTKTVSGGVRPYIRLYREREKQLSPCLRTPRENERERDAAFWHVGLQESTRAGKVS